MQPFLQIKEKMNIRKYRDNHRADALAYEDFLAKHAKEAGIRNGMLAYDRSDPQVCIQLKSVADDLRRLANLNE